MDKLISELGEASKRSILIHLKSGPKSVGDLVGHTGLKQPNVSNHLSRMRAKGLVRAAKVGRQVFYSLGSPQIAEHLATLTDSGMPGLEKMVLDGELVKVFCRHAVAGDEAGCEAITDQLTAQKEPLADIYEGLFGRSMQLVGTWWEVGAIDTGQEHLASAIVERLMARSVHRMPPAAPGSFRAVLGCPPGNWHTLGLRMVSDVMRLSGWSTFYLGANVPIDSFLSAVANHQPDAVLFSSPLDDNLAEVDKLVESLNGMREGGAKFKIVGGGAAVFSRESHYMSLGVDFIGRDLAHFRSGFIDPFGTHKLGGNHQKPSAG